MKTKSAKSARSCPKCAFEGPFIGYESELRFNGHENVSCPKCQLHFENSPAPEFVPTGIEYLDRYLAINGSPDPDDPYNFGRIEVFQLRRELTVKYSWAVPSPKALKTIAKYGPVVEMGAGGGYWAMLLRERGVNVIAYDKKPYDNYQVSSKWSEVLEGNPEYLRDIDPRRSLFICWPSLDSGWAEASLLRYPGKTLIYVGEGDGGCNANDAFFNTLNRLYEEVKTVAIPQWAGIHDYLAVYKRRGTNVRQG